MGNTISRPIRRCIVTDFLIAGLVTRKVLAQALISLWRRRASLDDWPLDGGAHNYVCDCSKKYLVAEIPQASFGSGKHRNNC